MASRKRRAPGAAPQVQPQPGMQNGIFAPDAGDLSTDQMFNGYIDPSIPGDVNATFDPNFYGDFSLQNMGGSTGQSNHNRVVSLDGLNDGSAMNAPGNSGQLVRRNPNHQLTARGRSWDMLDNDGQQGQWDPADDDEEELEQKAMLAKKEAQAKRKSIPPFVQKLSSFLDDNKNTNLIRWSDDGNSFIVLDEDEFARTLIPELFKHNNYASFVRQLNMYGFHKKVGLSDNSMKASETKAKAPSEYYNKYFKRGKPDLLWLIQKPKNPPAQPKRKREDDKQGDSDEDRKYVAESGGTTNFAEDGLAVRSNQDMAMIPRTEYNSLRGEVRALQQQQKVISNVLGQIRRQNDQLYQQATAFQTLHERHENSINAILTFLATFYNRTVEGQNGANLADLFGASMPQQQTQGSVVDVGDYPDNSFNTNATQLQRTPRKPLALLPAPAVKGPVNNNDRAGTITPSIRSGTSTPNVKQHKQYPFVKSPAAQSKGQTSAPPFTDDGRQTNMKSPSVPLKAESPSIAQPYGTLPETDEIMSAIQNVNASTAQTPNTAAQFDFPAALANYETQGGNVPLTQQQRNDVLNLMANNTSAASPNSALAQNSNNAMVSPQPPAMPDMQQFAETAAQLELLQKMSEDTNSRVQTLQERLQPLSPSGSIPGLENSYFGDPGTFDLNNYVQNDDFFPDMANNTGQTGDVNAADATLPDLDFNLPETSPDPGFQAVQGGDADLLGFDENTMDGGGTVESVASSAASPAVTVEDVDEDNPKRSPKRRKR